MSNLKVNFGALSTAAADIQSGARGLEQTLANMDRSLQPLRANWTGSASDAYDQAKVKWTAALNDMKVLLGQVGQAVDVSGQDYQSAERANVSRW